MGRGLNFMEDLEDVLEIFLNFLTILCLETALDALVTGTATPVGWLCVPLGAALLFYLVRRAVGNLPLFLLFHAGVVWVLFFAGSKAGPLPVLWQIAFVALGAVYALHSLKVRLTGRRDNEGEIPPSAAAVLAVCACFVCGYMGQENGAQRIIGLCFLWLCGYFLKKYLGNFQRYVGMSRRGTGAMPEKNIFFAGMRLVLAYIAGSLFLLFLLTRTTLLPRIAQAVGMVVRHLLRLFFGLLIALIGEGQAEGSAVQEQGSAPDFSGIFPYAKPPVWLEVLEKILTAAVALAMAAGAVALVIWLVRYVIRTFYAREREKREFIREGFVEEEEFLGISGQKRGRRLFLTGGSAEVKVRRIFCKTAASVCGKEEKALGKSTARELGSFAPKGAKAEWEALCALYEKARYSDRKIVREDVREAGKLSGRILHTIK